MAAAPNASGVVGSLGLSISVASLVALFSRWNEHVTTNPTHPSPRTIASGAAYSYRSRDSSASPPVAPSPSCASKVLRRLARRSVPSSSRGALRRISISASRLSASSASSSIVALSPDEKCVAALGRFGSQSRGYAPLRPVQNPGGIKRADLGRVVAHSHASSPAGEAHQAHGRLAFRSRIHVERCAPIGASVGSGVVAAHEVGRVGKPGRIQP